MRIISGKYGGRSLKTVSGPGYRPATAKVRGALFSMLESRGMDWHGARVLDLFAGSGALAFESISRGAATACFVEMNKKAAAAIRTNAAALHIEPQQYEVFVEDAVAMVGKRARAAFDLIFIDPPYGKNLLAPVLSKVLRLDWLAEDGFICAEIEAGLDVPDTPEGLDIELVVNRTYGQTRILLWAKG